MSNGVIESGLMDKIKGANSPAAVRNVILTFNNAGAGDNLCQRIFSGLVSAGPKPVSLTRIIEVLNLGNALRSMGADPAAIATQVPDNIKVSCLSFVNSISFSQLPDAIALAIAQNSDELGVASIAEDRTIHEI